MKPARISPKAATAVAIALALVFAACGGDKKAEGKSSADDAPTACKSDGDCADGLVCLGGECTDTSAKALYDSDSTNAVTPEKVQREVDQRTQQHVDRANEALNAK